MDSSKEKLMQLGLAARKDWTERAVALSEPEKALEFALEEGFRRRPSLAAAWAENPLLLQIRQFLQVYSRITSVSFPFSTGGSFPPLPEEEAQTAPSRSAYDRAGALQDITATFSDPSKPHGFEAGMQYIDNALTTPFPQEESARQPGAAPQKNSRPEEEAGSSDVQFPLHSVRTEPEAFEAIKGLTHLGEWLKENPSIQGDYPENSQAASLVETPVPGKKTVQGSSPEQQLGITPESRTRNKSGGAPREQFPGHSGQTEPEAFEAIKGWGQLGEWLKENPFAPERDAGFSQASPLPQHFNSPGEATPQAFTPVQNASGNSLAFGTAAQRRGLPGAHHEQTLRLSSNQANGGYEETVSYGRNEMEAFDELRRPLAEVDEILQELQARLNMEFKRYYGQ